jgi:acyl transferase domain-containing protein
VIKVLLQMKHGTLVKSLHCEQINPYIQLEDSPFFIVKETQPWEALRDRHGRTLPRRAGVSSFGIGGVNAHLLLEEHCPIEPSAQVLFTPVRPALIVLSAKNEERLKERARQLLAHLGRETCGERDLASIAYTLQVGREPMDTRLAFTAVSIDELKAKLASYLTGTEIGEWYRGDVKRNKEALASLNVDEDARQLIASWLEKGKYQKLLELWAKGLSFQWSALYAEGVNYCAVRPRRISLPTYPFAKQRFWVDAAAQDTPGGSLTQEKQHADRSVVAARTSDSAGVREAHEPIECLLFSEAWQGAELSEAELGNPARVVVVMLNERVHRRELRAALQKLDAAMSVVFIAALSEPTQSAQEDDDAPVYAVDARRADSYEEVLRRIAQEHGGPDALWYLWALEDAQYLQDQSPILYVLQGLADAQIKSTKVLLGGAYDSSLGRSYLESWIGYERSIGKVLPDVQVSLIHWEASVGSMSRWAQRLWRQSQAQRLESTLYEGEQRYVLRVQPLEIGGGAGESVLRRGGTYLITGGMGGLGRAVAEHLARRYAAKLILTGRSSVDASKQQVLAKLEELGGEGLYVQADSVDAQSMSAALAAGRRRFGTLHGVIHAAGVESSGDLLSADVAGMQRVWSPKIVGTVVLSEVLKDEPIDFLAYFSSISAVLGDFGSCDYAVGNRFELAHAKYVEKRAIALCWPLWKDGGMGHQDDEAVRFYLQSSRQRALETSEGMVLLNALLDAHGASSLSHAMAMVGQRSRVQRALGMSVQEQLVPQGQPIVSRTMGVKRAELQGLSVGECVLWELQDLASEVSRIPRADLDADESLAEFGFDSIGLASFARRISTHYAIEVSPSIFFSHSTLRKVSQHLCEAHTEAMGRPYAGGGDGLEDGSNGTLNDFAAPIARSCMPSGSVRLDTEAGNAAPRVVSRGEPHADKSSVVEPIAIIGMSGRFPGARSVDELWDVFAHGREVVREIPLERFDWRGHYAEPSGGGSFAAPPAGKTTSKWLGMLPGVEEFDPLFFEIAPGEADVMDPRQRLLLQEAFKALEDAGYGSERLEQEKVGIFVGVEQGDYQRLVGDEGSVTGNHDAILAARLSFFLNLRGPAMAINTACSSGLVAAHQGCMSLRAGECDTAIAAGVNLILTVQTYVLLSRAGMLSPQGRCYAFDQRANGMVPGEAVVAVVLKRLSQAQSAGDLIYGVIRGSEINCDGKTNGLTAPSGAAQRELIVRAHEQAGVRAQDIEYVVTHGTGTRLGDPVEINALSDAFGNCKGEPFCAITSTKTNLGHTFAASGLVSLVSVLQAMRHGMIPASLHCEQLSNYIDWERSAFYVNTQKRAWPAGPRARIAAVSAFGMSGTNAHIVVQSYEESIGERERAGGAPYYLLALSAKCEQSLLQRASDLLVFLQDDGREWDADALASLSYTLLSHRQHFSHRCAMVVADRVQAQRVLERIAAGNKAPSTVRAKVSREFVQQPMLTEYANELMAGLEVLEDTDRYQKALASLADLYCQGYRLDWKALFGARVPRRMRLPTYPFLSERHWVKPPQQIQREESQGPTDLSVQSMFATAPSSNDSTVEQLIDEVLAARLDVLSAARQLDALMAENGG